MTYIHTEDKEEEDTILASIHVTRGGHCHCRCCHAQAAIASCSPVPTTMSGTTMIATWMGTEVTVGYMRCAAAAPSGALTWSWHAAQALGIVLVTTTMTRVGCCRCYGQSRMHTPSGSAGLSGVRVDRHWSQGMMRGPCNFGIQGCVAGSMTTTTAAR